MSASGKPGHLLPPPGRDAKQRPHFNAGVTLRIYSVGDCRKSEMTIGANYPSPVQVNGYLCKNCTDVDLAKKHIDPAHPRSGPYGINAKDDPTANKTAAVIFGGALSSFNTKLARPMSRPLPIHRLDCPFLALRGALYSDRDYTSCP